MDGYGDISLLTDSDWVMERRLKGTTIYVIKMSRTSIQGLKEKAEVISLSFGNNCFPTKWITAIVKVIELI